MPEQVTDAAGTQRRRRSRSAVTPAVAPAPSPWRFLPFAVVILVLLYNALGPNPLPLSFSRQDKLHHLVGFVAVALALRVALPRLGMGWFLGLTLGGALLIEMAQAFMPSRTASTADMAANVVGVLLGWALWQFAVEWRRARQPTQHHGRRRRVRRRSERPVAGDGSPGVADGPG